MALFGSTPESGEDETSPSGSVSDERFRLRTNIQGFLRDYASLIEVISGQGRVPQSAQQQATIVETLDAVRDMARLLADAYGRPQDLPATEFRAVAVTYVSAHIANGSKPVLTPDEAQRLLDTLHFEEEQFKGRSFNLSAETSLRMTALNVFGAIEPAVRLWSFGAKPPEMIDTLSVEIFSAADEAVDIIEPDRDKAADRRTLFQSFLNRYAAIAAAVYRAKTSQFFDALEAHEGNIEGAMSSREWMDELKSEFRQWASYWRDTAHGIVARTLSSRSVDLSPSTPSTPKPGEAIFDTTSKKEDTGQVPF